MTSPAATPAEEKQRPLSESIAAATRSVHAKLNKIIITRLPLAIPPRAADPSLYVSGLLHITPIYDTFESLWKTIAESPQLSTFGEAHDDCNLNLADLTSAAHIESNSQHQPALCERTRSILTSLYLPALMRSDRLRADIGSITGWAPDVVNKQLAAVSQSGRLAEFTRHMKRTIEKKPHVLMAYSYILFMALFAGGRFIRATLESAGTEFWEQIPSPIPPSQIPCQVRAPPSGTATPTAAPVDLSRGDDRGKAEVGAKHMRHSLPLSFFHFATALDGEDLKKEFKKRLAESEHHLSPRQRRDIIQEAVCIFDNMLLLVGQLDNVCDTDLEHGASILESWASLAPGGRLRDSVAVARDRKREKTTSVAKGSEDSEKSDSWLSRHTRQKACETPESHALSDLEKQPPACCPASKSMRFEPKLAVPHRKDKGQTFSADGAANAASSAGGLTYSQWQMPRSATSLISNIIIVAGLAAIVSMFFLARKTMKEGVIAEEE
ncbi:hypothetical protein CORC01_08777 [Colletotrichum orchidophilum]|uniref:Heme oxygenase n=1 Tax=Colletotrichum orchidophilum TaxID=1209926 RepID=A0A1G4B3N6_9PEZI|nr:uncharacterized protein CORC01_08777 [Colletotrichum orchidophilum]OHE95925.1 hypothetical protein CORC01_08777 [Colletotrichum orchidophilum]